MEQGFVTIFDGSNLSEWQQLGPGRFVSEDDGSIRSEGGMGLPWYPKPASKKSAEKRPFWFTVTANGRDAAGFAISFAAGGYTALRRAPGRNKHRNGLYL